MMPLTKRAPILVGGKAFMKRGVGVREERGQIYYSIRSFEYLTHVFQEIPRKSPETLQVSH